MSTPDILEGNVEIADTSIKIPGKRILTHQQQLESRVSELLGRESHSFPGSQPVSFSRCHFKNLLQNEYVNIFFFFFSIDIPIDIFIFY